MINNKICNHVDARGSDNRNVLIDVNLDVDNDMFFFVYVTIGGPTYASVENMILGY